MSIRSHWLFALTIYACVSCCVGTREGDVCPTSVVIYDDGNGTKYYSHYHGIGGRPGGFSRSYSIISGKYTISECLLQCSRHALCQTVSYEHDWWYQRCSIKLTSGLWGAEVVGQSNQEMSTFRRCFRCPPGSSAPAGSTSIESCSYTLSACSGTLWSASNGDHYYKHAVNKDDSAHSYTNTHLLDITADERTQQCAQICSDASYCSQFVTNTQTCYIKSSLGYSYTLNPGSHQIFRKCEILICAAGTFLAPPTPAVLMADMMSRNVPTTSSRAEDWNMTTGTFTTLCGGQACAKQGSHVYGSGSIVGGTSTNENGNVGTIHYVGGSTSAKMLWGYDSIPEDFTICSIARYSGSSSTRGRILSCLGSPTQSLDWLHGHSLGRRGPHWYGDRGCTTCSKGSPKNWAVMCGRNTVATGSISTIIDDRIFTVSMGGSGNCELNIGYSQYRSNWELSEVHIWDYHLSDSDFQSAHDAMLADKKGLASIGSPLCQSCGAGKYQTQPGAASCIDCEMGTYSTAVGATNVFTCLACRANSASPQASTAVTACLCNAGFSGPDGGTCVACATGSSKAGIGDQKCDFCDEGTYSDALGSVACTDCGAGKFSMSSGAIGEFACQDCRPNSHSPPGTGDHTHCYCNAGMYGLYMSSGCTPCAPGTYKIDTGAAAACTPCAAGTYSAATGASSACSPCPQNSSSPQGSAACTCNAGAPTNSRPWVGSTLCKCNAGYSGPDGGPCAACEVGKYRTQTGSGSCIDCNGGTYSTTPGAATCLTCNANSNSPPGSSGCTCNAGWIGTAVNCSQCSAGKYSNVLTYSECLPCNTGLVSRPGSAYCYIECGPGRTYTRMDEACSMCVAGKYKTQTGPGSCLTCNANSNSPPGSSGCTCNAGWSGTAVNCIQCSAGKYSRYSNVLTYSECLPCNTGLVSRPGSTYCYIECGRGRTYTRMDEACTPCPTATFKGYIGPQACTPCTTHATSMPGSHSDSQCICEAGHTRSWSECVKCVAATYKGLSGDGACTACPNNRVSRDGSTSILDCMCAAGFYPPAGDAECAQCAVDEYKAEMGEGTCQDCLRPNSESTLSGGVACECSPGYFILSDYDTLCTSPWQGPLLPEPSSPAYTSIFNWLF